MPKRSRSLVGPYRSNYERRVADFLTAYKVPFEYETKQFVFYRRRKGCAIIGDETYYGPVYTEHVYTTDFWLPDQGICLEAKGRFSAGDRTKLLAVKEETPEIDLRMVLMRNNKLNRRSNTTYANWCDKHGMPYVVNVDGEIPLEWISNDK